MKKYIVFILIMLFSSFSTGYCSSYTLYKVQKNPTSQVKSTLKQYNKALQKHNIEKIKTFYDENYLNSDGFNIQDMTEMLEKTYSMYKNLKYKTKINNIAATNNWAIVQMSDVTSAIIYPEINNKIYKNKSGNLYGESSYIVYLKKDKGVWKIISEDILSEETSLRYGLAKKINIDLNTPAFIQKGKDYDISLKVDVPNNIIALGAISKEEIVYPAKDYKEKYRKLSSNGELVRLVKANENALDEYGIASIGLTKLSYNEEENKAKIEVLGMAYVMKRINMEGTKKSASLENN